jgi:hypothetical protein
MAVPRYAAFLGAIPRAVDRHARLERRTGDAPGDGRQHRHVADGRPADVRDGHSGWRAAAVGGASLVALLIAVLFGLAPGWRASAANVQPLPAETQA